MNKIEVYTHDGEFHADEIFACVLLRHFLNSNLIIHRTRNRDILNLVKKDNDIFVLDVGDIYEPKHLNFDHHQSTFNNVNDNNIPLSTCGLVWSYIKENTVLDLDKIIISKIDEFVERVDKLDNGIEYFSELSYISTLNLSFLTDKFYKAYEFSILYFDSLINGWEKNIENDKLVDEAILNAENGVIFSDQMIYVNEKINATNNELLVAKKSDNEWYIFSLNIGSKHDFSVRCPAPSSWAGHRYEDLNRVSGFKDMVFCHKNLFLTIVSGSKDHAINVAKYIISNKG